MTRTTSIYLLTCLLAALVPIVRWKDTDASAVPFPGWPAQFNGQALQPLNKSRVELQFESDFPGRIGKFTDGTREYLFRWVTEPTRMLHPAADCLKGSGYSLRPLPLLTDDAGRLWGCMEASSSQQRVRVRERIEDQAGNAWTDVSAWYWAAMLGKSQGPWWAVTVVEGQEVSGVIDGNHP